MSIYDLAKIGLGGTSIGSVLGRIPFTKALYRKFALTYRHHAGLFCGVYRSYEDAEADIIDGRATGWNNEETASIWLDNIAPMREATYPLLMWLSILLRENMTLVDYGGSIGLTYYGFKRYFTLPTAARWVVAEVDAIAAQGQKIAGEQKARVEFVTSPEAAPPADILISAGAIQYIKDAVPGLLDRFCSRPRHVLLNKVPLTSGPTFWTLQNFGSAVSPYQVYNESEFLRYFTEAGYRLRDRWDVHELDCFIPFHPDKRVPHFAGLYFEKAD
ncbi:TIGR04325 family methyltransferase [Methylocella silvestris]|nr:TIGR04325 family methyltransferase [Methylocella silvestris]